MEKRESIEQRHKTVEQWSSTAFLIAGFLWLLDTVLLGVELVTAISILGTPGAINGVLYISGTVIAIVGLLGLFPRLAGHTPRLARISATLVAVASVAITSFLIWFIIDTPLKLHSPPEVLFLLGILVATLGFLLFGIASVKTEVPSRTVGYLVLGIPATLLGGILLVYVGYGGNSPDWTSPAIGVLMAAFLLAIGYGLRTQPGPTTGTELTTDTIGR